ncbi:AI-2E family transporter [Proteiniborus sp. MB09-C3]|uniref:AI-2E family transporter n=1 Tax=Proteiniborus sp. MB09-C3 TaxID=3050072 RepID=UPI0025531C2D|nr:AI-2E family transporter [Proteiniborus sp. MB09-C3]WIV11191.1 AI-2E family transporter [Proteiniborus sp. MB09-C3]
MDNLLKLSDYLRSIFITALLGLCIYFLLNIGNRYVKPENRLQFSRRKIIFTFVIVILIVIFYNLFKGYSKIAPLLLLVFYSIVLSYLLNPLVNIIEKRGFKRSYSILLIYLFLLTLIILLIVSIVPKLSSEFENLVRLLPSYFNRIYDYFNNISVKYSKHLDKLPPEFQAIKEVFFENLKNFQVLILNYLRNITNSAISIFSKMVSFVIVPIMAYYFLKDKDYFKKKITLIIPKNQRNDVLKIGREVDKVLGRFIRGQLLVCTFVGISSSIALLIIGVDFAIIIGLVAGIADIIPYFGPIIGIFPAIVFALLKSPMKALWVIISFTVIQQLESNIIAPKIVGESVGVHPVIIMLALLIGGSYFGITGMLFAIPATIVLKIVSSFLIDKISRI